MAPLITQLPWMLVFYWLACQCSTARGLFDWLKQPKAPSLAPSPVQAEELPGGEPPPFEIVLVDDKFLAEAKQMELSELDSCHFKVVAQLKSTCGSLSEEQLAKLGVVLFNCQAEVEGRRTYPCTETMSIKQCTADMDPDTWNAYHIVSNRARSVCYATRQQHFRRRAELTVNALISTASSQLDAMKDLKEGQLELRELTTASLEKLFQGHSALQAQQGALWHGQEQLESSLNSNLERLSQEKALIASGQELVAQLIQGITQRMESVSVQLKDQGSEVQEDHKAIINDLADVREQAQDIYNKIDHSMSGLSHYQNQTARYYADLMGKLERMNGTLGFMLGYLEDMHSRLEKRLYVIQGYLSCAGLSLTAIWTCVVHTGYFLLCAVLLTFLNCPCFSRAVLLLAVPLNAVAEVNQQSSLDLTGLSLLVITLSLGHWFVGQLFWACAQISGSPAGGPSPPKALCKPTEPEKPCAAYQHQFPLSLNRQRDDELDRFKEPDDMLDQDSFLTGGDFDAVSDSRSSSPNNSLISNSSVSGRQLCNGITKTGKACKKKAVLGKAFCRVHEGGYTSYVHQ
ncbi:protein brambleberry [Aplochiton taeniatus]